MSQPDANLPINRRQPPDIVPVRPRLAETGTPAGQFEGLLVIHKALRGRFRLVIVLGLLVAAAAGYAVHRLFPLTYRSEGLVQISYELPDVGDSSTDQNRPMTMFDTFIQSQKLLITSHLIVEHVSRDPAWAGHNVVPGGDLDAYFAKNLIVEIKPHSEYIQIAVRDTDPNRAAAAATAVISAYRDIYENRSSSLEHTRLSVLEDRCQWLTGQIDLLHREVRAKVAKYGTINLDLLEISAQSELTKLDDAIEQVKLTLAVGPVSQSPSASTEFRGDTDVPSPPVEGASARLVTSTTQPLAPAQMTPEDIAAVDPNMARRIEDRDRLRGQLADMKLRGLGDAHWDVISTRAGIQQAEAGINTYAERFRRFRALTSQNLGDPRSGPVVTAGKSPQVLAQNLSSLQSLRGEVDKQRKEIGLDLNDLRDYEHKISDFQSELEHKNRRIEQLTEQASLGGRLTQISSGNIPLSPDDRNKHYGMVAVASVGGACLPAALVLLLSLFRRRYETFDELQTQLVESRSLLGIIPDLDKSNPEQLEAAVRAVHQIRVLLQGRQGAESHVYLLTSATAGEGKTSLTLSLGLSFAAARLRTLIIDCDLIGRGLSRMVGTADEKGLHEMLRDGKLEGFRRQGGLHFLPAGKPGRHDACALSASGLESLLAWARRHFNVILLDSGPILGSVEAAVAARLADSVIFTVARGQDRGLFLDATDRLERVGVGVRGLIFNRAAGQDFARSSFGSSAVSSSVNPKEAPDFSPREIERLGPLAGAVASAMPTSSN